MGLGVFKDMITFDNWMDVPEIEDDYYKKRNNTVYIVLENIEYLVSKLNGNHEMLIDATDPMAMRDKKVEFLDVKGLGFMKYRCRKIISAGRDGGLIYYLHFDLAVIA